MANAIANATANAMANAVTDHGTVAGRPKATGYLHFDALRKPFGCFFLTFCYLLEAFWYLLDALGDLFWNPGRLLAHFGPGVRKVAKKLQIG